MKSELKSVSPTRTEISLVIDASDLAEARNAVVKEIAASASIPGFRKGKAPASLVEKNYAKRIASDAEDRALRKAYRKAVSDAELKVFELVSMDDRSVADDGAITAKITVDLFPQVEIPETDGIAIDDVTTEVKDEQVDAQISRIREAYSEYVDFHDSDVAAEEDMLNIDFAGTVDGKPLGEVIPDATSYASNPSSWCTAGSDYFLVPGLPKDIIGKKIGEKGELDVEFPADFYKESLRGVKAHYTYTVVNGRRRILAELDEKLFKRLKVQSEEQLRKVIRDNLESSAKASDRARHLQQISDYLAKNSKFELPAHALEHETEHLLEHLLQFNMEKGVAKEDLSGERDKLTAAAHERASSTMRVNFVIDAIREKLNVSISNEEFSAYFNAVAAQRRLGSAQLRELSKNRAALRSLYQQALREKVLGELLKKAKPSSDVKVAEPSQS